MAEAEAAGGLHWAWVRGGASARVAAVEECVCVHCVWSADRATGELSKHPPSRARAVVRALEQWRRGVGLLAPAAAATKEGPRERRSGSPDLWARRLPRGKYA